jgi:hypothetical protein
VAVATAAARSAIRQHMLLRVFIARLARNRFIDPEEDFLAAVTAAATAAATAAMRQKMPLQRFIARLARVAWLE